MCCSVQLCIRLEELTILQLPLDLLSGSNECHAVHRRHDRLLDDFTAHLAFQALSDLNQGRVLLVLNIADDKIKDSSINISRALRLS